MNGTIQLMLIRSCTSLLIILMTIGTALCQQSSMLDSLKNLEEKAFGKGKLTYLNLITELHLEENAYKAALKNAREAEILLKNIFVDENYLIQPEDRYLKPLTYYNLGRAYYFRQQYTSSREAFDKAELEAMKLDNPNYISLSQAFIYRLDSIEAATGESTRKNWFGRVIPKVDVKKALKDTGGGINLTTTLETAKAYEKAENYNKAIEYYEKAINILRNQGDWERISEFKVHVAELHQKAGHYTEAIEEYQAINEELTSVGDTQTAKQTQQKVEQIMAEIEQLNLEKERLKPVTDLELEEINVPMLSITKSDTTLSVLIDSVKQIADAYEESEDFEQSLSYYKQYLALEQQMAEEQEKKKLALLEKSHQIESKEQEIVLLRQREVINATLRKNLIIGVALALALAIALYFLYKNKKRDHKRITTAYHDLEVAQEDLSTAQKRIKTLLNQQVSGQIAQKLITSADDEKIERRFACIMFLDIRGFTPFAEQRNPEEIIAYQNEVFGFMIDIIQSHHGIINQLLGDGFMATFGAPLAEGNVCENAYLASKAIIKELDQRNQQSRFHPTKIGIGLHAGYVVTGNVGSESRKQYSITGNTVILAARLEQLNKKYGSQLILSEEVYEKLPEELKYDEVQFEEVQVKGRSKPIKILKVA